MIQFVCFFKNCLQFPVPFLKTSISKSLFPRILLFLGHVHWKCKQQQKRQPTYQQPGLVVTSFCEFFDRWIEVLLEGPHPFPPHLELELGPPPIGLASLRGAMSTRCRFVSLKKHIFVKWKKNLTWHWGAEIRNYHWLEMGKRMSTLIYREIILISTSIYRCLFWFVNTCVSHAVVSRIAHTNQL